MSQGERSLADVKQVALDISYNGIESLSDHAQKMDASADLGEEAMEAWSKIKHEFYAISSLIIADVVEDTLNGPLNCSTEDLIEKLYEDPDEAGLFYLLHNFVGDQLKQTLSAHLSNLHSSNNPIYQRYRGLEDFILINDLRRQRNSSDDTILRRGVNTASKAMSGILQVIPDVYRIQVEKTGDSEIYTQIATNSYPLVARIATLHIHELGILETRLKLQLDDDLYTKERLYVPGQFAFSNNKNGLALQIKSGLDDKFAIASSSYEPRIGCPAMVNFGEGSAIKKLWQWHISHAPKLYEIYES